MTMRRGNFGFERGTKAVAHKPLILNTSILSSVLALFRHMKTVNLRGSVGCEPCLFPSFCWTVKSAAGLNGPFYKLFWNSICCRCVAFAAGWSFLSALSSHSLCVQILIYWNYHSTGPNLLTDLRSYHLQVTIGRRWPGHLFAGFKYNLCFLFEMTGCKASSGTSCTKKRCWPLTGRDEKLPTMGSKTVDRGTKKLPKWAKKLPADEPIDQKARQQKKWGAGGWVCWLKHQLVLPMCQKWAQKSETLYSFSKTLTQINQVIHTVNCRCWDVRKQIALLCLCIGMLT